MMFNQIWSACAAAAAAATLVSGVNSAASIAEDPVVGALAKRAADAHAGLMRGDIGAYRKAIQLTPDFTLMDPFGGPPTAAPSTDAHWQRIGRFFQAGRRATFKLINAWRTADMVVLVANETAYVAVGALPAQDWSLRVTLVFRRDHGEWRLAHRHADPLVKGLTLLQAARVTLGQL